MASLFRDPLPDEGGTVREFDPARFRDSEEHHGITIDQLDFREVDGDDTALLDRGTKDVQVVSCHPATDAQNDTRFDPNAVDSAGHRLVAGRSTYGKRDARWRHAGSDAKPRYSADAGVVNPEDLVNVVNLVMRSGFSET